MRGGQRGGRRAFRFRLAYLVVALFMGLFAYTFSQKTAQIRRLDRAEAALSYANQQMVASNVHERRVIAFDRTPRYVEETARTELGYTKPGEISVQSSFVRSRTPAMRPAPRRAVAAPQPSWKQWLHTFSL